MNDIQIDDSQAAKLNFRLGFNANTFTTPKIRGFTRHTLNLIQAIHEIAPHIEIYLYANRDLSPLLMQKIPFAKARILPIKPYFLWEQFFLPLLMALDNIDIFHSTLNTGIPFFRPFFSSTVQTVHDCFTHEELAHAPRNFRLEPWRAFLGFKCSWRAARSADALITVSDYSRAEILRRYIVMQPKLNVIHNAVDPIFSPGPIDKDYLLRFGLEGKYILYMGGFDERKNISCLLRAYEVLRIRLAARNELTPKLVLIGALTNKDSYPMDKSLTQPGIVPLSYCPDEVLLHLVRGAEFGVFPSRKEGFGFSALEFFACGVAALLSDIPAYREIASGAAPRFSPDNPGELADLMEEMLHNPEKRAQWAEKSLERSREFSWRNTALSTLAIYHKLIS